MSSHDTVWHVVTRLGEADPFDAGLKPEERRLAVGLMRPADPRSVRNDVYEVLRHHGLVPPVAASDFLHLALAVYTADLRVPRSAVGDRWTRDFVVHLPVTDVPRWTTMAPLLSRALGFLTGDTWDFQFRTSEAVVAKPAKRPKPLPEVVCLFSGGLDSLVGAVDLLAVGRRVALVGHHGSGSAQSFQSKVLESLRASYAPEPLLFYVQPPKDHEEGENTMRSRSLLFLALGIAVATSLSGASLVVPENGLISLNVPLTDSRTGSLSTRTTHPHFIELFRAVLHALEIDVAVELPYRFKTKGEMLRETKDPATLKLAAPSSMSCSHPDVGRYRGQTPGTHCGYCVPCIIRRAAMSAAGFPDAPYDLDVVAAPPAASDEKGRDLRAYQMAIERLRKVPARRFVMDVLKSGPIPPQEISDYAGVYRRGMEEVRRLLSKESGESGSL